MVDVVTALRWQKAPPDRPGWWWCKQIVGGSLMAPVSPVFISSVPVKESMRRGPLGWIHENVDEYEWSDRPVEPPGEGE